MRQRIVIIEDEPDIIEMVGYNFRKEGFHFASFTRGRAGLADLRNHIPDLLLLDIMLPDQNGLEICRELRADDRLKALPIVFLTAKAEEVDRILGLVGCIGSSLMEDSASFLSIKTQPSLSPHY